MGIFSLVQTSGSSIGNVLISIIGSSFSYYPIYCKIGGINCLSQCIVNSLSSVSCTIPSHFPGNFSIQLLYNNLIFYSSINYYSYLACSPGFESIDYR